MTPDQILATFNALITLVKSVGILPLSLICVLCILGPWVVQAISLNSMRKDQATRDHEAKERFEAVVRMYENNASLAHGYESLARDLSGIIHLNTQTQTQLVDAIKTNQWCPSARKGGR